MGRTTLSAANLFPIRPCAQGALGSAFLSSADASASSPTDTIRIRRPRKGKPKTPEYKYCHFLHDNYGKTASFVFSDEYTAPILSWLDAGPGDRILDLGCGSGELTVKIQNAVGAQGFAMGIDYNEDMVSKATRNGVQNALVCDIQELELPPLEEPFDAAFSNAALHWCKRNPAGVLEGLQRVLKPGGRFVCEMGGFMNCIGVRTALHHVARKRGLDPEEMDPWYFPTVEGYQQLLQNAGFRVDTISLVPRLTPLGDGGLRGWLQLFARGTFLKAVSDVDAEAIMDEVEEMCVVDCQDGVGNWSMMYVRLRFAATLDSDSVD